MPWGRAVRPQVALVLGVLLGSDVGSNDLDEVGNRWLRRGHVIPWNEHELHRRADFVGAPFRMPGVGHVA